MQRATRTTKSVFPASISFQARKPSQTGNERRNKKRSRSVLQNSPTASVTGKDDGDAHFDGRCVVVQGLVGWVVGWFVGKLVSGLVGLKNLQLVAVTARDDGDAHFNGRYVVV